MSGSEEKKTKVIHFPSGTPGSLIVPVSTEEDMHEFGLYDKDGEQVDTGYFKSMERAIEKAKEAYPGMEFTVRDLDEEWYVKIATEYRKRIKKLRPSFTMTNLVLDMSKMYLSRNPNDWYTYIPFTHRGVKYDYRETADGTEWITKVKELSKPSLNQKIEDAREKTSNNETSMTEQRTPEMVK